MTSEEQGLAGLGNPWLRDSVLNLKEIISSHNSKS